MSLFFSLVSLLAAAGYMNLTVRRGWLSAPLAPFTVLCGVMVWFSCTGMLGLLRPAGYLFFAGALAAWAASCLPRNDDKQSCFAFLKSDASALFFILSIGVIVLFSIRQPMFTQWDEFSFWGTAAKIVKYSDGLYVNASIGWDWVGTHRPGLIVMGYFLQFFGDFAEWRVLAGYDVFLLSILVLPMAVTEHAPRRTVPAFLFALLLPFAVLLYGSVVLPVDIYASTLSDVPLGLAFGGVFAVYLMGGGTVSVVLALAALGLIKDTGFALSLVAAAIICLDYILQAALTRQIKAIGKALARCAALLLACVAAFLSWQRYLAAASTADTTNVGGVEEMGMVQMVFTGLREMLGIGRTEKFARIMGNMVHSFCAVRNTMLGPGVVLFLLALAMCVGAALLTKDETVRRRGLLVGIFGACGYLAYFCFIGFTYVYVFTEAISDTLVGFERYLYPYLMGWLLAAACLVVRGSENERLPGLLTGGFLAETVLVGALVWANVPLSLTAFAGSDSAYASRRETRSMAAEVQQAVPQDARIFFVSQGDDGNRWFLFTYELYPWYLDYSGASRMGGGGTFALPGALPDDTLYYHPYTAEELLDCIRSRGCDYVFIERTDELFNDAYAELFSDGLAGCAEHPAVYVYNESTGLFDCMLTMEGY